MKKLVLLGDSIRQIGYGLRVPEMLKDEYVVVQPDDNCRYSKYTLRMVYDWRENLEDADVIHWNNGHWDVTEIFGDGTFTTEEEYVSNMTRLAKIFLAITPKVIFSTTVPSRDEYIYDKNDKIERFNKIIVPVLRDMGVHIVDMHAIVAKDVERYIRADDLCHLTDEGIELCAKAVVDAVREIDK